MECSSNKIHQIFIVVSKTRNGGCPILTDNQPHSRQLGQNVNLAHRGGGCVSTLDESKASGSFDAAAEDLFPQRPSDYLLGIIGVVVVASILAGTVFSVVRYLL